MKLADLHIDRFGARKELSLSGVADQLNVIYGPNGAGKTTVIQFVRWMMFGQRDEISRRYLTTGGSPASGSMTIRDAHGTRTLQRTCQLGSLLSHLTVESDPPHSVTPPIGLSSSEFDRFFTVSFDQPRSISDLFNSARSHGFQLHVDQRQLDRIQQLTVQLDRHRADLTRLGHHGTTEFLRSRREEKRRELEANRLDWQRRREDLEHQRDRYASESSEQQVLADRSRSVVANIDVAIENRTRQLADEHQQWAASRHESEERRGRGGQEIDAQLARWQDILTEVRARLEQVRARISAFGEVSFSATEATDLHFFMRRLGFRIRDIEQDLSGVYQSETWRDHESDADYLRGLLGSALNSMQGDVTRLCQTVERQQQANELHECREELTYLCRVEQELADLVTALSRQRRQLGRDSEFLPNVYGTETGSMSIPRWRDDLLSVSPIEIADSLSDFRLRHLVDRRESAAARLNAEDLELSARQHRLREIESELARFGRDGRTELLEREAAEIDEQLRQVEHRHQLERTIATLEDELQCAREHSGQSQIVDDASAILQSLTNNDYRAIRVMADHQCQVARSSNGQEYAYTQLSRGVQDQVYLALSLAMVSALARRGVIAPLILNDVFGNLDQSGTHALANVLREFAGRGHQILVFTRHEHIRELFARTVTKLFTLDDVDSPQYAPSPFPFAPAARAEPPVEQLPIIPQIIPTPVADLPSVPPNPSYEWVAEWQRKSPVDFTPVTPPPRVAPRPEPIDDPNDDTMAVISTLGLNNPLTDATIFSDDFVRCLAEIGVVTVEDLIELDPEAAEQQLHEQGVTGEMIQRRQRELLMIVYLGVSVQDAQLLVACGVPDPARLSRADEAVLLKRIETILERPQATQRFGPFSQFNLQRVRSWIQSAQRSDYRGRSRRNFTNRSSRKSPSAPRTTRRKTDETRSTSQRRTVKLKSNSGTRFYLETNDPVVDGPSIGPKTAEKLNAVGVYTVAELLDADTDEVAARLDDRRISRNTVAQWQSQAQLVCRIPNLRGHDAQILVACGIDDPITLSSLDASTFLKQVSTFVDSKDGMRVVRNGKKPDLAEVTAWIEWSQSARQLRAA